MTAANILVYPDVAILFTDTKATTENGDQYNTVKFVTFPWMRMALAVRGYVGALRVFERQLSANATNYDQAAQFLLENFAALLEADYADQTESFAMKQDLDVYIVGFGAGGSAAHWISNYRNPGKLQRIPGVHISPMVDREAQAHFASDVKTGMPNLMIDQARQNPAVGGWLMITEIFEDRILTYPHGGLDALSSVASRRQPEEEILALAEIGRLNTERARRLAALESGER